MSYVTTATQIFDNNQAVGWWTDKDTGESLVGNRSLGLVTALIHSEVSEAMEGFRKDLNDDHLPERKMIEVEIADAAIRAYDFLGSEISLGLDIGDDRTEEMAGFVRSGFDLLKVETEVDYLSALHSMISDGYTQATVGQNRDVFSTMCYGFIIGCEQMSERFGYDLTGAIKDKLAYNKNRADHKLENRNKEGGKAF